MNIDDIIDGHMTVTDPLLRTAIRDVCLLVADAEREACARLCETEFRGYDVAHYVATAIRARGSE